MSTENLLPHDEPAGSPADNPQPELQPRLASPEDTTAAEAAPVPRLPLSADAQPGKKVEKNVGSAEPAVARPATGCSERKRRANRANAQKSTGPRTARGKAYSRFNAVKHGLCAQRVMFTADGKPVEGLKQLAEALDEKYGSADVATELLKEALLADYWRVAKALEHETESLAPGAAGFYDLGMPNLTRYMTANRASLLRDVQMLEERQAAAADSQAADHEATDGESADDETAGEAVSEPDTGLDKPSAGAAAACPEEAEAA